MWGGGGEERGGILFSPFHDSLPTGTDPEVVAGGCLLNVPATATLR